MLGRAFFAVGTCVGALVLTGGARAQDDEDQQGRLERWRLDDGAIGFVWENDIFGGTDRNYSNGVQMSITSGPAEELPGTAVLARAVARLYDVEARERKWRSGLAVGHKIFTPNDITLAEPNPLDRPYAGYLFSAFSLFAESGRNDKFLDTVTFELGLVGPAAGGEWVQSEFHKLIDGQEPLGWDNQLHNELAFAARFLRQRRTPVYQLGPFSVDGEYSGGVSLGTLDTSLSAGVGARFGRLFGGDYGPPRIRPAQAGATFFSPDTGYSWYLFAGIEGRVVGRNIFLDGNTFRDSPNVAKNELVGDLQGGLVVRLGKARLTFTYVQRAEEFERQEGNDRFGAGAISWRF